MSVEEVEHSQYSGEGSLCWFGITHMVLLQRAPQMCPTYGGML